MDESLIAPCGMNCAICSRYLAKCNIVREQGITMAYCAGCRPRNRICALLKKRCSLLSNQEVQYCCQCQAFPCKNLCALDERYRARYRMSMIDNLKVIRDQGIKKLLASQEEQWKCPGCGGTICCHNGLCFKCDKEKLEQKKNKYRWEGA